MARWLNLVFFTLSIVAVAILLVVVDIMYFDLSGKKWFVIRQGFSCQTGFGLQKTDSINYGVVHAKLYRLNDSHEFALLVVCDSCHCPVKDGWLLLEGKPLPLKSHWQTGETGYWGHLKPLDMYVFTYGGDTRDGGMSGNITLMLPDARPGSRLPIQEDSARAWSKDIVACTYIKYNTEGTADVAIRNWVKHMKAYGVKAFRVYMAVLYDGVGVVNLFMRAERVLKGLRVTHELVRMEWIRWQATTDGQPHPATDTKSHGAGNLWAVNDCLLSNKAGGTQLMIFLDLDEYPSIGSFPSFSDLAHGLDVVSFPSVSYATTICLGGAVVGQGPMGTMVCRDKHPECAVSVMGRMARHCLGPLGRRKYLVRPDAVKHLWAHSWDPTDAIRVWHATGDDGVFIRHYRGLQRPGMVIDGRFDCTSFDQCNRGACSAVGTTYICDA